MRLHKFIANCGYTSRRRAELLIRAGRVTVNGKVLTSLGTTVKPQDVVAVNGEVVRLPDARTVIVNKPAGIISSTHDTHERLTVMDILPRSLRDAGVVPVGRLDQDTEGLLILTNVGDLNHRITHPSYEIEKEYEVVVTGSPSPDALRRLETGLEIDGLRTDPARVGSVERDGAWTRLSLVLTEGRKRQVRKMFSAVGHEVVHLRRVRVGGVRLEDLPCGAWRELRAEEIASLGMDYERLLESYRRLKDDTAGREGSEPLFE
jgi:23S rRNA pseudouridine2605 synthase